jgi:hypothetical protein
MSLINPSVNLKNSTQTYISFIFSGDFLGTTITGANHGDSQSVIIPLDSFSSSWRPLSEPHDTPCRTK